MERIVYRITLDVSKSGIQTVLQGFRVGESISRRIEISLVNRGLPYTICGDAVASMYVKSVFGTSVNACTIEDNKIIYDVLDNDISRATIVEMQVKVYDNNVVVVAPKFQMEVETSDVSDEDAEATPTYTALEAALLQAQTYYNHRITGIEIDSETFMFYVHYADDTDYESDAFTFLASIDSAEQDRVEAEIERANAELERESAEGGRVEAEEGRVAAEEARESTFGTLSKESEAWAKGTKDNVPVTSEDPQYHNNSKYYAEQAASSESNAASSERNAASSETNAASSERNAASSESNAAESESNAASSKSNASASALVSEGFAKGTQNGVPVDSSSPYYHNNAEYFKNETEAIAGGHVVLYDPQQLTDAQKAQVRTNIGAPNTLNGQTDTDFQNLQDGESPIWDATRSKWVNGSAGTHIVQTPVPKTKTYTYDGTTQAFEWDSIDSNLVIVTNGLQVDAGTYSVICSLKNANDVWADMTNTPKTFAWVIGKAAGDFTLSSNSASVSLSNPTATIGVTGITGDGAISVSSSDSTIATASYSNGVVTITGLDNGTETITVSLAEGTNYLATSKIISVTSSGFIVTITVNGGYEDDITIKSADGQTTIATVVFDTGETSKQVSVPVPASGEYLFSSLDYDHADGTADKMEKVIKVDGNTTEVKVMPSDSAYWRGNSLKTFSARNISYGNHARYIAPTITDLHENGYKAAISTNNYGGSVVYSAIDTTDYEKLKILHIDEIGTGQYDMVRVYLTKQELPASGLISPNYISGTDITSSSEKIKEIDISEISDNIKMVLDVWNNSATTVKGLWTEKLRSLPLGDTMNVTFTLEGANEDKITIYDKYGEVVDYVDFASGATSATVTLAIRTGGEKLKFVSSVAKDTNNKNFYVWADVDSQTTNVAVKDANALLWYLNGESNWSLNDINIYSDWNKQTPTKTTSGNAVALSMNYSAGQKKSGGFNSPVIDVTNLTSIKVHIVSGSVPTSGATSFATMHLINDLGEQISGTGQNLLFTQDGPFSINDEVKTLNVSSITGNARFNLYFGSNGTSVNLSIDKVWVE